MNSLFYVLFDNEGMPLNKSYSYGEDISLYIDFLGTGLKNYKKLVIYHKNVMVVGILGT